MCQCSGLAAESIIITAEGPIRLTGTSPARNFRILFYAVRSKINMLIPVTTVIVLVRLQ